MTHEEAILAWHAVVVSDAWLDEHEDAPWMDELRTAHNRRRYGVLDEWVAYLGKPPADLERRDDGSAIASGKYLSEINGTGP